MDLTKPILICASGNSVPFLNSQFYGVRSGIPLRLESLIKYNYSIGLNYWFRYGCTTTFNTFADWQFYLDNTEILKKAPLIIGSHDPSLKNHKRDITHKNTILLKNSGTYFGKDSWGRGIYAKQLIGIWSLTLAIALGFKEIYLLGYDCKEINGRTHFYQGVIDLNKSTPIYIKGKHVNDRKRFRGIGKEYNQKLGKETYKTSTYNNQKILNNKWFAPFHSDRETRKTVNIYNVSPESAIDTFPKITYEEFYEKVKNNHIDQIEAREDIKQFIKGKTNENNT